MRWSVKPSIAAPSRYSRPMSCPRAPTFRYALALAVLWVLAACPPAMAREILGWVVGITDGDTLTLLTDQRQQMSIRLAEIDAPERRQPFGDRAQQMLADLAFDRRARIVGTSTDRNGRLIGTVFVGSRNINAEMVRRGGAWVFRRYAHDPALLALEDEAREARRGLWSLPEPQRLPPWEWRESRRPSR